MWEKVCGRRRADCLLGTSAGRVAYVNAYAHAPRQLARDHLGDVVQITLASTHRWALDPAIGKRAAWNYSRKQFGGSIVVDAINNPNTVRWLTDKKIVAVTATHVNRTMPEHPEFEDNFAVLAELEGGATANISFSWLTPDAEPTHGRATTFIVGTQGLLDIRSTVPEQPTSERETRVIRLAETEVVLTTQTESAHRIAMPQVSGASYEEDFLADVRDPSYTPMLSTAWTLESTRISLAARQSADEHHRIAL